ncbi:MAG TPA: DUF5668 domain-containing protein [Puia sp.]|nr:DUF5668 domain-containing protein [Puia sp.]
MDDDRRIQRRPGGGRIWAGLFLLGVGGVLLLDQMGFPLPDWLFSWHVLLVAIGIFIGLRHNFRGGAWLILIAIGGIYLIQDFNPEMNLHRFIWPGILILIGLIFILRPRHCWDEDDAWKYRWKQEMKDKWRQQGWQRGRHWHRYMQQDPSNPANPTGPSDPNNPNNPAGPGGSAGSTGAAGFTAASGPAGAGDQTSGQNYRSGATYAGSTGPTWSSEDWVDTTSVFGGVHKKIVSKNFKGGDITTFLGGTELDLTQADFTGVIRLDVTQVMGGTKIIVPAHWEVRSQVTAIFAGFEDKRQQPAVHNPEKVLILEGTSIFGGIELKNY